MVRSPYSCTNGPRIVVVVLVGLGGAVVGSIATWNEERKVGSNNTLANIGFNRSIDASIAKLRCTRNDAHRAIPLFSRKKTQTAQSLVLQKGCGGGFLFVFAGYVRSPLGFVSFCCFAPLANSLVLVLFVVVGRPPASHAAHHRVLVEEELAVVAFHLCPLGTGGRRRRARPSVRPAERGARVDEPAVFGAPVVVVVAAAAAHVHVHGVHDVVHDALRFALGGNALRRRRGHGGRRVQLRVEVSHGSRSHVVLLLDVFLVLDLLVAIDGAQRAVVEEDVVDGRGRPDHRRHEVFSSPQGTPGAGGIGGRDQALRGGVFEAL
mmetsp:Transcript_27710/g.59222  ORF Transcript_27710/g.59222 Transcript_27710/m.59222 type:complete len:321 (+) Transcript_27710:83-1045(+)